MNTSLVHDVLEEFGRRIGLNKLAFDADSLCNLIVDDDYPVTLRYDEKKHYITIVGELSDNLQTTPSLGWVKLALSSSLNAMLGEQPSVGFDMESGVLVFFRNVACESIDVEMLEQSMTDFIAWREAWIKNVQELARAPRDDDSGDNKSDIGGQVFYG